MGSRLPGETKLASIFFRIEEFSDIPRFLSKADWHENRFLKCFNSSTAWKQDFTVLRLIGSVKRASRVLGEL